MEKILTDFGIQPVYLAAQIVNFIILLLILKKFLYKPILKVLEERKETVATSLLTAENIEYRLQETDQESQKKLREASAKAKTIINNAKITADQIIADAHAKVKADIENMMEKGKQNLAIEREAMKNELRKDLTDLVILGVGRVAGKVLDEADQKNILTQTIKGLEHSAPIKTSKINL
jgi:F-type H+-transporting ATPase subunit b